MATAAAATHPRLRIVWTDEREDLCYWAGPSNGHDGEGWTDDHREALTFASRQDADADLQAARQVLRDYRRGGDVEIAEVATW